MGERLTLTLMPTPPSGSRWTSLRQRCCHRTCPQPRTHRLHLLSHQHCLQHLCPYAAHVGYTGYTGYTRFHAIGKRDADADAYTTGQVAAGLPYANAVATGHAHNPGHIAYTSFPARSVYNTYAPFTTYGYGLNGVHYG